MKEIQLTQCKTTQVDDDDYTWLNQWSWYAKADKRRDGSIRNWYAARNEPAGTRRQRTIRMHRAILQHHGKLQNYHKEPIDHHDSDGLNNCKCNLRTATHLQNTQNRHKRPNTTSVFKGTSWSSRHKKWRAQIQIKGKARHLGLFTNESDAAQAYDCAAINAFGTFAHCNFPTRDS